MSVQDGDLQESLCHQSPVGTVPRVTIQCWVLVFKISHKFEIGDLFKLVLHEIMNLATVKHREPRKRACEDSDPS